MSPFVFQATLPRVVFGAGALSQLPQEVEQLGLSRVLVLCAPGHAKVGQQLLNTLGPRGAGLCAEAEMHVPVEIAQRAVAQARALGADGLVTYGGGSTTGLGKAIALETGLSIIAVPTSYAGSEMTSIYGLTADGLKKTGRDARVLPRTVIYDPDLSTTMPWTLTVTSAFNAMAHAAEGLYAHDGNPIIALMAEDGVRALAQALPVLHQRLDDGPARGQALYGAWLCGVVLGNAAMGLHHKLCHTLGGSFNLPHAEVHTVVLPHALAYNAVAAPQAMAQLARALGVENGPLGLWTLAHDLGAPLSLRELGMPAEGLDRAADLAAASPYPNPRPLEREALRALLQRAWEGQPPG